MARYQDAIAWIVGNDDTEWLDFDEDTAAGTECVTAAMVADLFNKTTAQVRADLLRVKKRQDALSARAQKTGKSA